MDGSRLTYDEFLLKAMLYDQTQIVDFLLKNESKIDLEECICNNYDYRINLPSGMVTMPSQHYYDLIDA